MENNSLEEIVFENRAWAKAEYPRLHMIKPEKFKFTKIQNFSSIKEKEIHLAIGYHHVKKQWYLEIFEYEGTQCNGDIKIFNSIKEIKEHIKKEYKKIPILPERWNMSEKKEYGFCESCRQKTEQKTHPMKYHRESNQHSQDFECLKCGRIKRVWI